MNIGLLTPDTDFSRDVLGRYACNTFDDMLVTIDPNARTAAGLPSRGDLRPFDFIVVGGGTFGGALAEHLWFRATGRSERILVLDGGPFLLSEHVQNLPVLGLNAGGARMDHLPQNEVWGLAWNAAIPFPGLAYCLGGRSVFWGGWSPQLLDGPKNTEMPRTRWPDTVVNDLNSRYFREAALQIGVTETNDFIFGDLHDALRQQLFEALDKVQITGAISLADLPPHLDNVPNGKENLFKLEAPL